MNKDVTIIIVGKNEDRILNRCFDSASNLCDDIIYVDSDSTDSSIEIAKKYKKIKIISLKTENYYHTASLARSIASKEVNTKYIQFIDADMTLDENWINIAKKRLEDEHLLAAAVGYKKDYASLDSNKYTLRKDNVDIKGIKNAQIEAPGAKFLPGILYTIKIEHDGGLRIDSTPISPILKGEKLPV